MPEHYVLHFPFKWLNCAEHDSFVGVSKLEPDFEIELIKTDAGDSEIVVKGLPNRPFAEGCVIRCWFALMCVSTLHHRPCEAALALAEPEFLDPASKKVIGDFLGVDYSDYDSRVIGTVPYVRGSDERVIRHNMTLSLIPKREDVDIGEELLKWMWHPRFFELVNNRKLRLALDLANLVGYDAPKQARFILIMSAIEALLPDDVFPEDVLCLVSDWQTELKGKVSGSTDPQYKDDVQRLLDKTSFLRSPSISSRLKTFAAGHPPENVTSDYVKLVARAYELRSNLVHKGDCDEEALTLVYPVAYGLLHRAIRRHLRIGLDA